MEHDLAIFIGVLLIIAFYFLPTIIGRNKKNVTAIFLLNLLLGWTIIGWIIALIWATTYERE